MDRAAAKPLIAAALLSASALLLEIVLTRLFSLLYYPPYVFFILSIAILGIGIGAALPARFPMLASRGRLALYAGGGGISALLLIGFAALGISGGQPIPLFILAALPYAFFGLAIAALFSLYPASSRMLYMSDLAGAGVGAILAIPLLNNLGAIDAALVAGLGFSLGGLCLGQGRGLLLPLTSLAAAALILGANLATDFLDIDMANLGADKPITRALNDGGQILETHWDAFARSDLVDPGRDRPLRIYVDGAAASVMPSRGDARQFIRDIGFFPFATEQPQQVFVIGPGAGLDVWFGLRSQARAITAVEVNPASVAIVNARPGYHGDLYGDPAVTVIIDDGRSVLRRSGQTYDLIFLSQVVTLAAERGGYALSENSVYTVDAFDDYLAHLNDGGQIALKLYDEITLTRALSTAIASLRRRGLSDQEALAHLMAFVDDNADPPVPLLLIGQRAYSKDDSLVLGAIAAQLGFRPQLLPEVLAQPPLDAVAAGDRSFDEIVRASGEDISPASDDRPFFFQFERGIPSALLPIALIAALVAAVAVSLCVMLGRRSSHILDRALPGFFALLGIGFICVEIYAIQRARLFLGHPTLAITLALAIFLLGGGIGSGLSQRFMRSRLDRQPWLVTALIVLLLLAWSLAWQLIADAFIGATPALRALIVALSLLPLALCMGLPFPAALTRYGSRGQSRVALAWSLNGLMTVVGSVCAVLLSIVIGYSAVALLGGGAYLLATLLLWMAARPREAA